MAAATTDNIVLYTNHRCPWAHRAHIALNELKVPHEEVIIDLDTPRTPEYLQINPRGLVPSLAWNGQIITESAVVSQFLADAFPPQLLPEATSRENALLRARIAFFADTYISKVQSVVFKFGSVREGEEAEAHAAKIVDAVVKEIEPLLGDAKLYFGGSDKITLAEVLTASFVIRLVTLSKAGVYPTSLVTSLQEKAPKYWKWAENLTAHPSVRAQFPEEEIVSKQRERLNKTRAAL